MTPKQLKQAVLQLAIQGKLLGKLQRKSQGGGASRPTSVCAKVVPAMAGRDAPPPCKRAKNAFPPITQEEIPFEIPKHWQWKRLGEIAEITTGNPAPQKDEFFENGEFPFVRVVDMGRSQNQKFMETTRDKLNFAGTQNLRKFPAGTILFTKSGASLLLNQRAILEKEMFVVSHIGCVIPEKEIFCDWVFYWFKTIDFKNYAQGTSLPALKISLIKDLPIPLPPLDEQKAIVARLEELLPLCEVLEGLERRVSV